MPEIVSERRHEEVEEGARTTTNLRARSFTAHASLYDSGFGTLL